MIPANPCLHRTADAAGEAKIIGLRLESSCGYQNEEGVTSLLCRSQATVFLQEHDMSGAVEWSASRVYDTLIKGTQTERDEAVGVIADTSGLLDRKLLATMLIHAIQTDFSPSRDAITEAGSTRDWLLSALARLSQENSEAQALVLGHLDPAVEPQEWVRYWTLAGLVAGKVSSLTDVAKKVMAYTGQGQLVTTLAEAILAPGDPKSKSSFFDKLRSQAHEEVWSALRALRIVLVPGVVYELVGIIKERGFSDLIYDSLIAIGRIPPDHPDASVAADALEDRLRRWRRFSMWDVMRVQALRALGKLKQKKTVSTVLEDLTATSPSIAREAAYVLAGILGVRAATARVVEYSESMSVEAVRSLATALRYLDRSEVVSELTTLMERGGDKQQSLAREFLKEIGGYEALRLLQNKIVAMERHLKLVDEAEKQMLERFDKLTDAARSGFGVMKYMDVVLFCLGILLLLVSAGVAVSRDGSQESWAGVAASATTGAVGLLSVLISSLVDKPRQRLKEAVDHIMGINIVFLGYLRQLRQVDQSFSRQFFEEGLIKLEDINLYQQMIHAAIQGASSQLHASLPEGGSK